MKNEVPLRAKKALREELCKHEWEPINPPGETLPLITADNEWCIKCGARRR